MKKLVVLLVLLAGLWQGAAGQDSYSDTVWTRKTYIGNGNYGIAFHPSSQFFAFANAANYVGLWDVNTARETVKYPGYTAETVYFSKTGKYIVLSNLNNFRIYNFLNDSLVLSKDDFPQFSHLKTTLSPDEKIFVTGSNGTLILWDIESGLPLKQLDSVGYIKPNDPAHEWVPSIAFLDYSSDNKLIAIGMSNHKENGLGTVFLFDKEKDSLEQLTPVAPFELLSFSHDGKLLAFISPDPTYCVQVMDLKTQQIISKVPGIVNHQPVDNLGRDIGKISFSGNDSLILIDYYISDRQLDVWNIYSNKVMKTYYNFNKNNFFETYDMSPDMKYIACTGGNGLILFKYDNISGINDNNSLTSLMIFPNPANDYITISVGANGCSPESIKIFDVFGQEEPPPAPSYEEGELRVDVSALTPGVYFVRVGEKVSKFVKI